MGKIILKGRGVVPGKVEGKALVCPEGLEGYGGFDPRTGVIKEYSNVNKGKSIKDTILVLPGSRGSNGWSCYFGASRAAGSNPKGWLFNRIDSSSGVAAAIVKVPTIVDFPKGQNPCDFIENDDYVIMDGDTGIVEIIKKDK
ncbi:DUF126 domain-containing protein [Wukongibacter baidiensis]|uniref:aconitase X swivel domain-containing protein n=1 Tax=Wukongibacter baidiensis TaxID=1723361 RepID=UPI003D7FAB55